MSNVRLMLGDCLDVMPTLEANSVDAIVTDPPAGIAFMNRSWDKDKGGRNHWVAWMTNVAAECLRLLKPGGHALVWALPRTSHWTATAWEDAGFEVRDCIYHLFGSGFPKSKNLGNGIGSALKPAAECWFLLRKPLAEKNLAENVLTWGTGGINVDASRIGNEERTYKARGTKSLVDLHATHDRPYVAGLPTRDEPEVSVQGRWPANVLLSEDAAALLDEQSGERPSRGEYKDSLGKPATEWQLFGHTSGVSNRRNDYANQTGGASRFFYVAKASKRDRDEGLEGMEERGVHRYGAGVGRVDGANSDPNRPSYNRNHHPTVKPTALMKYLCKLVTPPNGVILDPFMGSGSTGKAAVLEGFNFIGIELDAEYLTIAEKRISHAQAHPVAQAQPALFEVTA